MNQIKGYKNVSEVLLETLPTWSVAQNQSIVYNSDQILWVGNHSELPSKFSEETIQWTDLEGKASVTPGLCDSHTHLVFGKNRAFEYALRLNGATYEDIAAAGGGILNSIQSVREFSEDKLFDLACKRIEPFLRRKIRILEVKSGYGLDIDSEKKLTRTIDRLKKEYKQDVEIFNTFMAAHAIPKEFKSGQEYLDKIVFPLLKDPEILELIDAVDIFQEEGYFNHEDVKALFEYCKNKGIARKIHADEFNDNNGAGLAVDYQCLSADHLMKTSDSNFKRMAESETVATFLPGTSLFLGKPMGDIRRALDLGVKVAIASDYNPGSCHWNHLLQIASIAAIKNQMTQAELWASITKNACLALGFKNCGEIQVGQKPWFSVFPYSTIDEISYHWDQ